MERFDGETGVPMPLKAGEMSLHHTNLVHCSHGNDSDDRRIGLGISHIPASVAQLREPKRTALPVRGQAQPGAFGEERRLVTEVSDEAKAAHTHSVDRFRALQDSGAQFPPTADA